MVMSVAIAITMCAKAAAQQTIRVPANQPTIQAGIDAAQNGDTVLVAPGTYNENIDFHGKAITVTSGATSYTSAVPVINGTQNGAVATFNSGETSVAILNGFVLQNGHTSAGANVPGGGVFIDHASPTITNDVITNNTGCGVLIVNGASPVIQGNDIKLSQYTNDFGVFPCSSKDGGGTEGSGVAITSADSPSIMSNVIEENSLPTDRSSESEGAGISITGTKSVLIQNNIIRNNTASTEGAIGGLIGNMAQKLVLVQNLIYGNANADTQVFISGTYGGIPSTLVETNNTIVGGGEELVFSFGPSTIANNIVFNPVPTSGGIHGDLLCADPEAVGSPFDIHDNDLFTNGQHNQSVDCQLGNGNLSVEPLFLNPSANDFHEQPSSPTISAGDITAPNLPSADLDGKARTVCNTVDMGTYEVRPRPALALTSSNNPSTGGTSVTFAANIPGNCNVPTGSVTFFDGATVFSTEALSPSSASARASITTASLTVGSHNITVGYSGDFNFDASTSAMLVQVVAGYPTATTFAVSPNSANAFAPITLSSTVNSNSGTPPGTVTFTAGRTVLATATLNANGQATATISTLGAGTYSIVAIYSPTVDYAASSSVPVVETVVGAESVTALSASPNPALVGQNVTFAATVKAAQGSAFPTGEVVFSDGARSLGTVNLSATGTASFSTALLAPGTHTPSPRTMAEARTSISAALP